MMMCSLMEEFFEFWLFLADKEDQDYHSSIGSDNV